MARRNKNNTSGQEGSTPASKPEESSINSQMLFDVANLSFNNNLSFGFNDYINSCNAGHKHTTPTPGLMTLYTVPTLGHAENAADPVTVTSRSIYSFMRHANASVAKYDPADVMIYLLAMDSAYMYWAWMVRIYGFARTFNLKNKYYPSAAVKAMGADINDITTHLNDLRAYINWYGVQLSSFAVPTTLEYFTRHLKIYSNIYQDRDGAKSQTFMYNPEGFYKYVETEGPGKLEFIPLLGSKNAIKYGAEYSNFSSSTLMGLDKIKLFGDKLMQSIVSSEDIGYISADILKSYGAEKIYAFPTISEDYSLAPVFDFDECVRLHNSTVPFGVMGAAGDITQDVQGVIHQDVYVRRYNGETATTPYINDASIQTVLINMPYETPTPAQVMDATRMMAIWDKAEKNVIAEDANSYYSHLYACGSEVITHGVINTLRVSGSDSVMTTASIFGTDMYSEVTTSEYWYTQDDFNALIDLSTFDWAPLTTMTGIRYGSLDATARIDTAASRIVGDLQNFTTMDSNRVLLLHEVRIASLFGLPYSLYQN